MTLEVRYKPIVDTERCNTCSICVRGCPAELRPELRKEESSLRGRVYGNIQIISFTNGYQPFGIPPCQWACPLHQDVRGYISLIANQRYKEAMELIRETNPLPSVCGYICGHPCEEKCIRGLVDEALSIKTLKRFVADFDGGQLAPPEVIHKNEKKVAIIGSGPAGLAAAHELAKTGYQVEIIEAYSEPGGMLRWAIPPFRLPRDILNRDIKYIEKMGVTIRTNTRFGVDVSLSELKRGGVDAIIMAIGTNQSLKLVESDKAMGYMDCLTFLSKYASGEQIDVGDKTIVVGAGNAGIDSARTALRCGTKEVTMIDITSCEEIAADQDEMKQAQEEGVRTSYLTMPVRIVAKNAQVQGLKCLKTELGEPDKLGRRKPIPIKGSEFTIDATSIISAIGQQPNLSWNEEGLPFAFSPRNTFIVGDDCSTNIEGVFAAGDAVNGPTKVVEAMASGIRAAKAVDNYLFYLSGERGREYESQRL